MTISKRVSLTAALAVSAAMLPGTASAFDLGGKVVSLYAGGQVGGGVDVFSRTFMPFLARQLPGKPTIVVKNMYGAGGMQAVVFTYNQGKADGTALTTMPGGPIQEAVYGTRKLQYDLRKFRWIGSLAEGTPVCFVWSTSTFKTIEDAMKMQMTVSATGARSNSTLVPLMVNAAIGTKMKPIAGYGGAGSVLAVERGEVDSRCYSIGSMRATHSDWIKDGKVRFLLTVSDRPLKGHENVPYVTQLIKDAKTRAAMRLFLAAGDVTYPYALAPGTPDDAVKAYRTAFMRAVKDPEYLRLAAKQRQEIEPKTGKEVEKVLHEILTAPADTVEQVRAMLNARSEMGKCTGDLCRKKKKSKKKKS